MKKSRQLVVEPGFEALFEVSRKGNIKITVLSDESEKMWHLMVDAAMQIALSRKRCSKMRSDYHRKTKHRRR